jgi:phenylpropionate dioxygenase-like ring-hydroxylating dioxygenase large terminal subunit
MVAPAADRFPAFPASWYLLGLSREFRKGPVSKTLFDRRLAAFRTDSGRLAVIDGHCCHLGADLGRGRVVDGALECPFHNWRFGPDGLCCHIPASDDIPSFARQASYPVVERNGLVFVFRGPEPRFALPFFVDCRPEEFLPAPPFAAVLECPWYMVGANAFDLQHFRAAHDRRLVGTPVVDCPHPFARRATATFRVAGDSFRDWLTRRFAGETVTMSITDWCGNLMFATATFRRTTSYGMVITEPLARHRVRVQVVVFLPRSGNPIARACTDALRAWIRRYFIRAFLRSDAERLSGAEYHPHSLIDADRDMAEYFYWLSVVSHGQPFALTEAGQQLEAST